MGKSTKFGGKLKKLLPEKDRRYKLKESPLIDPNLKSVILFDGVGYGKSTVMSNLYTLTMTNRLVE